jgi:hypothetical protein
MPSNFLDEVQNDDEILDLLNMLGEEIISEAKRNIQKRNVITYPAYNVTINGKTKTVPSQMRRQTRVASGKLLNSLTYYIVRYSSGPRLFFRGTTEVSAYWDVIERGRRPNKKSPPSDAIEKWMLLRGIRPKRKVKNVDKWRKGMAYVIAQHIGAKGIKGIEYFQKATDTVMATYGIEIDKRFAKVLSVKVTDYLQEQINKPVQ